MNIRNHAHKFFDFSIRGEITSSELVPQERDSIPHFASPSLPLRFALGFALGFGFNEPAIALPNNPSVLAVNVLYNSGITAAQSAVYDGSMTPLAAQTAIVAAAATWIADNNVAE